MIEGQRLADNFALNIRAVRLKRGIKLKDLAGAAHMTPRALESLENGKTMVRLWEAYELARALRMNMVELMKACYEYAEE